MEEQREAEMRRETWRQGDRRGTQRSVRLKLVGREAERQRQGRWEERQNWRTQVGEEEYEGKMRQREGGINRGKERGDIKKEQRQLGENRRGNRHRSQSRPQTWELGKLT